VFQLSAPELLQAALAIGCAGLAIVSAVFLFVLQAIRRRRGEGWYWGWTFLAVCFGLESLAQHFSQYQFWISLLATAAAMGSSVAGVYGAASFRQERQVPPWAISILAIASIGAGVIAFSADGLTSMVAPELLFFTTALVQGILLLPAARTGSPRMSGLLTACTVMGAIGLLTGRTLVVSGILAARGMELNEVYWAAEVVGGTLLSFILAMGELVALLDEVRVELEESNEALNRALEGLEVVAKLDPLTKLYNRYAFYSLIRELSEGHVSGSIAIIDLNNLKVINDTFGHDAGDGALLNVAQRLREVVRHSDYLFRWGGDEFVAMLIGMPPEAARERLTKMQLPEPLGVGDGREIPLTVSWGVAKLDRDVDSCLREADELLYQQKALFRKAAAGSLTNT
jgi:diguanylate cyclase (GGDEF)-like protein